MVSEREFNLLNEAIGLLRAELVDLRTEVRTDTQSLRTEVQSMRSSLDKQTGFNSLLPWVGTIVVGLAALGAYLLK